jgi:DNA-binding XRE family transcriptional regulator
MERDWARLGRALAEARSYVGLTQVQVAKAIHVSRTPIQAIERGDEFEKITGTMRSYARLVGWVDGSIESVLAGGEPLPQAEAEQYRAPDLSTAEDLPARIAEEISEGRLLDTAVVDLAPYGSSARMIVVVRGAPDATPEEIRRDLLAWRRAQRHLQGLGDNEADDGSSTATEAQA